jgi:tetratricopeptide (TPR) repeat protein
MNNLIENIIAEIENKNYGKAIEYCDELILQQPQNESVYEIKAGCYSALKDFKNACENYQKAIDNSKSESVTDNELAALHDKKGRMHLRINEFENAAGEFKKSLELNPDSAETHNDYAACLRRLDLFDKALEHSSKAIQLKPDSAEFYNNSGNINLCLGRIEESLQDYTKAIELNPVYANAYFNRGTLFYNSMKDTERSKSDWQKAIELNPAYETELERQSPEISELLHSTDLKESPEPEIAEPESQIQEIMKPDVVEPVIEKSIVEEPIIEKPVVEEPVVDGPVVEETVIEKPVVEEPVVDGPVVEEPVVDGPVAEESVIEIPVVEEPVVSGTAIEEPVVNEPMVIKSEFAGTEVKETETEEHEVADSKLDLTIDENGDDDISLKTEEQKEKFEDIADKISIVPLESNALPVSENDSDLSSISSGFAIDNTQSPLDSDILKSIDLGTESNLSFSEYSDIFNGKKSDFTKIDDTDIFKPIDLDSENNFSFKDDTDILKPIGLSSESNFSSSEFKDIFDGKKTDLSKIDNADEELKVPDIDFKSIFNNNPPEEEISFGGEILTGKPLLTDEIKELHGEIEGNKTDGPELKQTGTSSLDSFSSKFAVLEKDNYNDSAGISANEYNEESKNWYSSPIFYIIVIGIILLAGLYTAYYLVTKFEPTNIVTVNTVDTANKTTDKIKDTVSNPQTSEPEEKTTIKAEQNNGTETKVEKTTESKFLGYLSEKNKFALFSEPDGFYVQIGSFKDKSAADECLKLLTDNNVKGAVFKADLEEKGILYRVRAGAFGTQEEAKKVMSELEK